jgi:hypothetical protein
LSLLAVGGGVGAVALGVFLTWFFAGRTPNRFSGSVLPVLIVVLIVFGLAAILRGIGLL